MTSEISETPSDQQTTAVEPRRIEPPEDPDLAALWRLAVAKVTALQAREPVDPSDWRLVTDEYHQLLTKQRGSLGAVIAALREQCAEVGNDGD
jgi:hypothetical protein